MSLMYIDDEQAKEIWQNQVRDDGPISFKEWKKQNRDNYEFDEGSPQLSRRFDGNVYQLEAIRDTKAEAQSLARALRSSKWQHAARVVPFKNKWVVYSQSRTR